MKHVVLTVFCALALSACQSAATASRNAAEAPPEGPIEITGSATTSMSSVPMVQHDPSITVFDTEGPLVNPLSVDRTRGVLENTTAGGYTVFDDSVTVYPLPGDDVPAYMPNYTVPPLKGQYKPPMPYVGTPIGLASASSSLPPVPTVDVAEANPYAKPPVSGAVRQPLTLTAVEPVSMQPPAQARAPMLSPFSSGDAQEEVTPAPSVPGATTDMSAGRRSGPTLTGY